MYSLFTMFSFVSCLESGYLRMRTPRRKCDSESSVICDKDLGTKDIDDNKPATNQLSRDQDGIVRHEDPKQHTHDDIKSGTNNANDAIKPGTSDVNDGIKPGTNDVNDGIKRGTNDVKENTPATNTDNDHDTKQKADKKEKIIRRPQKAVLTGKRRKLTTPEVDENGKKKRKRTVPVFFKRGK